MIVCPKNDSLIEEIAKAIIKVIKDRANKEKMKPQF